MAKGEAVIVIKKDGTSTCQVQGVEGQSCVGITEKVLQAVGTVKAQTPTDEFYHEPPAFDFLNRTDA